LLCFLCPLLILLRSPVSRFSKSSAYVCSKVLPLSKSRSSPKKRKKKIPFLKLCFLLRSSLHSPHNFCLPFWSWSFVLFFVFCLFSPSELKLVFSALIFVGANLLRNFLLPVALLLHEFKFLCKFCFGKHLCQYSSSASKLHQIWWQFIFIFSCVVDLCCSYNSSAVVVFGFGFWIILSIFGNSKGLFTFAMGIGGGGEARKHVCVTGNWGLLSSWLLRSLLERGYNVRSAIPKSAGAAKF
jgi:hypothetical protein